MAGIQCRCRWRGSRKYFWMGDHCVKLIQTGPRDGPAGSSGYQLFHALPGLSVPHRVRPMGIDQQVGIDGDQKSGWINQAPHCFPIHGHGLPFRVAKGDQPKSFAFSGSPFLQRHLQPFLRQLPECHPLLARHPLRPAQDRISNIYGCLHMGNHTWSVQGVKSPACPLSPNPQMEDGRSEMGHLLRPTALSLPSSVLRPLPFFIFILILIPAPLARSPTTDL